MTMFIIQSLLLIAIAYILGCLIGSFLRWLFDGKAESVESEPAAEPVTAVRAVPEKVVEAEAKPKTQPKPKPKPKVTPKPAPVVAAAKDDLKRIRGIGPQNESRLNSIGVTAFAQVAAWSAAEQRDIGERLAFPGRIEREDWVKQAKVLNKGGETQFSKRVDKGEVESSTGKASTSDIGKKPPLLDAAPANGGDNLTLIDGVGNALEKKLYRLGVYTFAQIAKWNAGQQTWIGNELGFPGRPERENWVAEAKILAKGGTTEHAKAVERGQISTSRKS
ncbi:MAG: hypothetical protein AAF217_13365 [Pseudomonadota bacterium]